MRFIKTILLIIFCCVFCARGVFEVDNIIRLLQVRSVFINGHRIDIKSELHNNEVEGKTENEDWKSNVTFYALKCEFAGSINSIFETLQKLIKNCDHNQDEHSTVVKMCLTEDEIIANLEMINNHVSDSINTLLLFKKTNENIQYGEPFFIKTLIMINFYILKISFIKNNSEYFGNKGRIRLNQANSLFDLEHPDNLPKPKEISDIELIESKNIAFVILQAMNLTERSTIENCYTEEPERDVVNETVDKQNINEKNTLSVLLNKFGELLSSIGFKAKSKIKNYQYGLKNLLLEGCFGDTVEDERLPGCNEMRDNVKIRQTVLDENGDNKKWVTLRNILKTSRHFYDIKFFYAYIKLIFDVIMKLVYQKSNSFLKKKNKTSTTEHLKHYNAKEYPTVLTNHLTFLDHVKMSHESGYILSIAVDNISKKFIAPELDSLSDIVISEDNVQKTTSLEEFLSNIFDLRFAQFWLVFNLMECELGKTSGQVYGTFLTWSPNKSIRDNASQRIISKCDSLKSIYWNFFFIEKKTNECLSLENKENMDVHKECFTMVYEYRKQFSNHLLGITDAWSDNEVLKNDGDLRKILIAAIVHLRNVRYTELRDTDELASLGNVVVQMAEVLKRTGRNVMNLLDNYQIHNCSNIKLRVPLYNEFENSPYSDNVVPIIFHGTNSSNVDVGNKFVDKDYLQVLTNDGIESEKHLTVFGQSISFGWYGEVKSFSDILKIDVLYFTVGLHRLIDYQHLLIKWLMSAFFTAWLIIYDFSALNRQNIKAKTSAVICSQFMGYLSDFIDNGVPYPNGFYKKSMERIYYLISKMDTARIAKKESLTQMFKRILVDPMQKILGVVFVEPIDVYKINVNVMKNSKIIDMIPQIRERVISVFGKNCDLFHVFTPMLTTTKT